MPAFLDELAELLFTFILVSFFGFNVHRFLHFCSSSSLDLKFGTIAWPPIFDSKENSESWVDFCSMVDSFRKSIVLAVYCCSVVWGILQERNLCFSIILLSVSKFACIKTKTNRVFFWHWLVLMGHLLVCLSILYTELIWNSLFTVMAR